MTKTRGQDKPALPALRLRACRWAGPGAVVGMMVEAVILTGCAGGSGGTLTKKTDTVEICLNGDCGPAAGRFSKEELIGGLLLMLKSNENSDIILCERLIPLNPV